MHSGLGFVGFSIDTSRHFHPAANSTPIALRIADLHGENRGAIMAGLEFEVLGQLNAMQKLSPKRGLRLLH